MMKFLKGIFTSGASTLVSSVGDAIDKIVTNDEERLTLRKEILNSITKRDGDFLRFMENEETNITKRWEADMAHGSWLSKNVRPLMLVFTILATFGLHIGVIFADFTVEELAQVKDMMMYIDGLTVTISTAYFGGRSAEKIKTMRNQSTKELNDIFKI